jgi:predicted DNA-binding transcriptional regulator AlpA
MKSLEIDSSPRLYSLIESLDCLSEEDLLLLTSVTPLTIESWRRRGEGPAYVRIGRRVLYPRAAVAEWLAERVSERRTGRPQGLL